MALKAGDRVGVWHSELYAWLYTDTWSTSTQHHSRLVSYAITQCSICQINSGGPGGGRGGQEPKERESRRRGGWVWPHRGGAWGRGC